MPVADFSKYAAKNTLVFKMPVFNDGLTTGEIEDWEVPPLTAATEIAVRNLQAEGLKKYGAAVATATEGGQEEDPKPNETEEESQKKVRTLGEYWAPIVAICVKNKTLDADNLKQNYPGPLLRDVGGAIVHFFLFGKLPDDIEQSEETTQTQA
jgi:hypothetical protein